MAQSKNAVAKLDESGARPLTAQQARFVHEFTRGPDSGNAAKAATAAGYGSANAASIGWTLVRHERVSLAIDAALREEIGATLTAQAVALMRRVIADEEAPLKLRADIAAKIVEFSGIVERVGAEKRRQTGLAGAEQPTGRRLGELTRQELEDVVRHGAGLLAAAATLPPVGQVIEGGKREAFTETQPATEQEAI